MLHPVRILITFGWIRAGGALQKCRNCFTRDEMGKRSPIISCSRVKYTTLSSSLTTDSAGPSGNSKSILWEFDSKTSTPPWIERR